MNNARKGGLAILAAALVASGLGFGYWLAAHRMAAEMAAAPAPRAAADRKPLYWHDPMVPGQKFDKPGKSPYMELVPVYADDGAGDSSVKISPQVAQNLGVRTVEAQRGTLRRKVEAVGTIAFDERSVVVVQARVGGYVERLYVRAPLDAVAKGQPLVQILAPDWVAAEEEYLALRRSPEAGEELRRAARQRLVLLGVPEEIITQVESSGKSIARITLHSPESGVVAELGAREGMTVAPGAMLFRINGLSNVWIDLDIPESDASSVRPGTPVRATVAAYPGEPFAGRIAAVLPQVSPATRTLKARVELANRGLRLKPGMYATVELGAPERRDAVLVPSEALIRTGQRNVVVVSEDGGQEGRRFKPVDVSVGEEAGGMTEILKGLEAGTKVVVSGQFLIDSESNLKSTLDRMSPGAEGAK